MGMDDLLLSLRKQQEWLALGMTGCWWAATALCLTDSCSAYSTRKTDSCPSAQAYEVVPSTNQCGNSESHKCYYSLAQNCWVLHDRHVVEAIYNRYEFLMRKRLKETIIMTGQEKLRALSVLLSPFQIISDTLKESAAYTL